MSPGNPSDRLKQFLPSDDEIDRALEAALREEQAHGGIPSSGPGLQMLRADSLAKGTVMMIDNDRVIVDLSYKSEGVVPLDEFAGREPSPGDAIEAWVMRLENTDGQVALSIQEAQRRRIWDSLSTQAGSDAVFRGKVVEAVKGGLVVDIGARAFMPAREVDVRFVEDLAVFEGQNVEVKIIELDQAQRRVIVSRRALLEAERAKAREALFATLAPGQVLTGTVTNIKDFGAFVDIGGAEGLLHIGDLAWGRVEKVEEVVQLGQELSVTVLSFDPSTGRIGLGLKQAEPSPWEHAATRYAPGRRARGKVAGFLDFGALVEVEPGLQGLLHVSEMSWGRRVNKPQDEVELGQEVDVEVLTVDPERRKLSLSMKKVEENPWTDLENSYPFASIVNGVVSELADFGAFVRLPDDIEGLIHVSEISWTERVSHPRDKLAVGDAVTAIVIGTDQERRRLSLSLRQCEPDPWWDVAERFPPGKEVQGTVASLKDFGALVEVAKNLLGLIHVSNLGQGRVSRARDVVRPGDKVLVEVLETDEENRRMGLRLVEVLTDES